MVVEAMGYDALVPFVPRLLLNWLDESPDTRLRALDGSIVFVDIFGILMRLADGVEQRTGAHGNRSRSGGMTSSRAVPSPRGAS